MVPRLGSPKPLFQARLGAAVALVVVALVLFAFFIVRFAG
jgi:hypothetical protein